MPCPILSAFFAERVGSHPPTRSLNPPSPESLVFYSLLPTPYSLSQSTFPTLTRLTLGVSPPYPRKSGFTSIFIRLHTLVFVRHSAARSLQTVFEIAHRNPSRPFPAWQRLPAPSRAPSFRPFLGERLGEHSTRRRMMVLSTIRPMNAIRSGPVPVFLTPMTTFFAFTGLSQERVQDQSL